MSTKTISKRVALATVVALGAGVLSLVSVSSASAVGTGAALGSNPALAVASTLYIAGTNSTTGTAAAAATSFTTPAASSGPDVTAAKSFGLLAVGDIAGNATPVAGTTQTATLTSAGGLSVYESAASGNIDAISVTGGTISSFSANSNVQLNSSLTVAANGGTVGTPGTGAINNWGVVVKPNSGVSTMTVQLWTGAGTVVATNLAGYASLTLSGQITVSVASGSASGLLSQTKSGVYYSNSTTATTTSDTTFAITNQPSVGTSAYNVAQYGAINLRDAYNQVVPAGILTATTTNGAYVALSASTMAPASAGSSTTAFVTSVVTNNGASFTVAPSVSTASTTTVTISYNGVVVGTKAFTFTGEVAKVILSAAGNGKVAGGATNYGNLATLTFKDSAGTTLFVGSSGLTGSYPTTVSKDSATAGTGIGLGTVVLPGATTAYTSGGTVQFVCNSASNSTGNLVVDYSNIDGTVITSNSLPVTCSGSPDNYTANFDKATYNPGDIATLTVTFKDSVGSLAADIYTATSAGVTASSSAIADTAANSGVPTIIGSNLTPSNGSTTTAGSPTDVTTNGIATYKFIVGSTSGSYQAIVDFPKVDSNGHGVSQTVAYTIASSGTSLNDVLKGIVSLIASINKQIAALAKLVTKK
jgi:hypothetical protein